MSDIGIFVPATAANNGNLSALDKLVFGEIVALSERNGYCFAINEHFAHRHACSTKTIQRSISNLEKQGFLSLRFDRGHSNRRIYPMQTSDTKVSPTDINVLSSQTSASHTSDNDVREKYKRKSKKERVTLAQEKSFIAPTVDEVAAYCRERENSIDAERFVDYYIANGWSINNQPIRDWKAVVRNWEKLERKDKQINVQPAIQNWDIRINSDGIEEAVLL